MIFETDSVGLLQFCHCIPLATTSFTNKHNKGFNSIIKIISNEVSYIFETEQFCNGDNRPPDCGMNCMCTHKVDIPLNAIVEVVLVDEGLIIYYFWSFLILQIFVT